MTDTLRWGILSTARINRRFIPPAHQSSRSQLLAVASRNLDSAKQFAAQWEIPLTFGRYEALLAMPEIEAVYIPLPNAMHCEWAVKAAEAGKHILCEKPLAMTVAEVDTMVRAAEANGVVLLEAVVYQMHPQLAKLKAVLAEGLIGQVKLVNAWFSITLASDAANIRLDPALGGGSGWDLGSYPVSLANAIAGQPPEEVFAWQQTDPSGTDNMLVGQMRYANGMMAQINGSFRTAYRVGAQVVGDQGHIQIPEPFQPDADQRSSGLIHIAPDDSQTRLETAVINPYLCQVLAMESCVLDGQPSPYPLSQSRINIATMTALYAAAQTGRSQPVEA